MTKKKKKKSILYRNVISKIWGWTANRPADQTECEKQIYSKKYKIKMKKINPLLFSVNENTVPLQSFATF